MKPQPFPVPESFFKKYSVAPEQVAKNALAANNPVFQKPAILVLSYGWSHPEPPPARASGGGRSRAATPFACGAGTLWRGFAAGLRMTLWPSKQPSFPKASTAETCRPHAYPWAVGRVTPCAPLLTSKRTSFPQPPPSQCFNLKKHIMQATVCKSVTLAAKAPKMPGRVATGFPLPSTGRGIEGEGWSYPERPPVRFFLYQHHPPSKLNT